MVRTSFNAVVGNPPYQGDAHQQLYVSHYLVGRTITNDHLVMVFPTGWQAPKYRNGLSPMNTDDVKKDRRIVNIRNLTDAFNGIPGAKSTNILYWRANHNNGLDGHQIVYTSDDIIPSVVMLPLTADDMEKPDQLLTLGRCVHNSPWGMMDVYVSTRSPYGIRSNTVQTNSELFGDGDIRLLYSDRGKRKVTRTTADRLKPTESLHKYKVFAPKAWGNLSGGQHLGGSYADVVIGYPGDACSESFLEIGPFDDLTQAERTARYIMTQLVRSLLLLKKVAHHLNRDHFSVVPIVIMEGDSWDMTIDNIDERLFYMYDVPDNVRQFVRENIQPRTTDNIKTLDCYTNS